MIKTWLFLFFIGVYAWSNDQVTLQLPWLHQFQFAGYYVAKEKGYYREAGLDVQIQDASSHLSPVRAVTEHKAQYGVGRSSLVVDYIKGVPVVLMAAVFQSSPMTLLVRQDSGVKTAKELFGKRVMLTDDTIEGAEIQAMFRSAGVEMSDLKVIKHSYDPMSLARREADAMVAYVSNEPFILGKAGIQTRTISPKEYGFDYYSDILFTSKEELEKNPERTKAFYDASIRGWLWAFDHIEETAELIYRNYNPQNKSMEALIYEGKALRELAFRPDTSFGSIDPVRLQMIAQGYRLMGVIKSIPPFDALVYNHSSLYLTFKERQWLKEHPVIRVGFDHNWPPLEFIDEKGRYSGINASYVKLLEKKLGIHFQIDYSRSLWSDSMLAVRNKELDMLSSAAVTEKRKEYFAFSRPYIKQSMVIVADSDVGYINDLDDLADKKVAIVRSYATEEILREYYPDIIPVLVDSSLEALKKVESGEAYASIEALGIVSYLIERHHLKHLKVVGETPYRYDLAFAFRKDWGTLAQISDKVLASMTPSEYQEIHGQWLAMEHEKEINYRLVWTGVTVAVVLFILIAYKNRRLDVLVRQRTAELEMFNQRLQDEVSKAVEKNRKQEKLLMQQAKMAEIGSMLESIAHQWRQPLNILGLSMTRLSLNCSLGGGTKDAEKVIEIAEAQIEYMSQTIDDFRNFFKQDRSRIVTNLSALVMEVEALLGPLLERKNIRLRREIDPKIEVLVYPNELKQVLINIINNAREVIEHNRPSEREILIRCHEEEVQCTIMVEDTGGGVPAEIIDKIFDPYFTTKFESQGTGIGLYMAKTIIEKHFLGSLSVYNTSKGACFEIRLNRATEDPDSES